MNDLRSIRSPPRRLIGSGLRWNIAALHSLRIWKGVINATSANSRKEYKVMPKAKPVSLHPLTFYEELRHLVRVSSEKVRIATKHRRRHRQKPQRKDTPESIHYQVGYQRKLPGEMGLSFSDVTAFLQYSICCGVPINWMRLNVQYLHTQSRNWIIPTAQVFGSTGINAELGGAGLTSTVTWSKSLSGPSATMAGPTNVTLSKVLPVITEPVRARSLM